MIFIIYKTPEEKEDDIWSIDIKERYTEMWYKEMMKRFKEWEKKVYDIDESYETWKISLWHLNEMINFLKLNK